MNGQESIVDLVAESVAAIESNNVDRMYYCVGELQRAVSMERVYTSSLKAVQQRIVVAARERLSGAERLMFVTGKPRNSAVAATAPLSTASACFSNADNAGKRIHGSLSAVGGTGPKLDFDQHGIPSLNSFPEWAHCCTVTNGQAEPGFAHLSKKNRSKGKTDGRYCIIAAAKSGCLLCLWKCLRQGTSIESETQGGWNVYDSAYHSSNERTAEVLRYITAAGGCMSDRNAAWIVKHQK